MRGAEAQVVVLFTSTETRPEDLARVRILSWISAQYKYHGCAVTGINAKGQRQDQHVREVNCVQTGNR